MAAGPTASCEPATSRILLVDECQLRCRKPPCLSANGQPVKADTRRVTVRGHYFKAVNDQIHKDDAEGFNDVEAQLSITSSQYQPRALLFNHHGSNRKSIRRLFRTR